MYNGEEGKLGAPPAFVLPEHVREPDVLIDLARKSLQKAHLQEGFDPRAHIAADAKRFNPQEGDQWAFYKGFFPHVLAVCQKEYGFQDFVAIPQYPWEFPVTFDMLLRPSGSRKTREQVVTCAGEVIEADISTLIFTDFLDPEDKATLTHYLRADKSIDHAHPEIFTAHSVFNYVRETWPEISSIDDIRRLPQEDSGGMAFDLLIAGLGMLGDRGESGNKYVSLAARRLLSQMEESNKFNIHFTDAPYEVLEQVGVPKDMAHEVLPEEHGIAYVPFPDEVGDRLMIIPVAWVALALENPAVALAHLARAASFVRDDYFNMLSGSEYYFSRELGSSGEISHFSLAKRRANGLAAALLGEIQQYDTQVYGISYKLDEYCKSLGRVHNFSTYDDPPEDRRSRTSFPVRE